MDEAEARGEHRLQPDRAVGGLGEGLALALHVLRVVRGADDVDGAVGECCDQRLPVVLGAERRRHLEEGAVGADVVLVQREMRDRGAGGDAVPGKLGAAERRHGRLAGNLRGVVAPAGHAREADVAVEHDRLRLARNAGKAEARRRLALVHHAAVREIVVLDVVHDRARRNRAHR